MASFLESSGLLLKARTEPTSDWMEPIRSSGISERVWATIQRWSPYLRDWERMVLRILSWAMSRNSSAASITGVLATGSSPALSGLLTRFRLTKHIFITTAEAKIRLNSLGRLEGILKMVSIPGSILFSRSMVDSLLQKVLKVMDDGGRTKLDILLVTGMKASLGSLEIASMVSWMRQIVRRYGSAEYCQKRALRYMGEAERLLGSVRRSEARSRLFELCDYLSNRDY